MLLEKCGLFLFVYIKRRANKEAVSIGGLLGIAVHKRKRTCLCEKNKIKKKKHAKKKYKTTKKDSGEFLHKGKIPNPIYFL